MHEDFASEPVVERFIHDNNNTAFMASKYTHLRATGPVEHLCPTRLRDLAAPFVSIGLWLEKLAVTSLIQQPRAARSRPWIRNACISARRLNRSRKRAPKLRALDRVLLGLGAMLVSPQRMLKVAVAIKPTTPLRFHRALVRCKYQWLFSSKTRRRPGPKGPSKELIAAHAPKNILRRSKLVATLEPEHLGKL
ncbi:MAG: hypothetical protein WDO56_14540 [Gammaproteobacteria bacterium]